MALLLLLFTGVKPGWSIPLAFAVSLAAPCFAAELDVPAKPVQDDRREEVPLPFASLPVDHAMKSLHRLRLRPGADSLDVSETSRHRPREGAE